MGQHKHEGFQRSIWTAGLSSAAVVIAAVVLMTINARPAALNAQADVPPAPACDDVRFLMQAEITPDERIIGGGTLSPDQRVTSAITQNDIGDYWSFVVDNATNSSTVSLNFTGIPAETLLEFAVFQGMTRATAANVSRQIIIPGDNYIIPTTISGIYTVVVQVASLAALPNLTPFTYTLNASFNGSGDVEAALRSLRDEQTSQEFQLGQQFELQGGAQVITYPGGAQVRINPGGARSVSTRGGFAAQIFFQQGSALIDSWAREINTAGGNFSVRGEVNGQPRLYYVEHFGFGTTLTQPPQSSLSDITDSNQSRIAVDWAGIRGVWVLRECMGIKFHDGRTFVIPVDPQTPQRELIVQAQPGAAERTYGCPTLYIQASGLNAANTTERQQLCLPLEMIEMNTEVVYSGGVLHVLMPEQRDLTLQGSNIRIEPLPVEGEALSFPITARLLDQDVTITLDWTNLFRFAYGNNQIALSFLDSPRVDTVRDGTDLALFEAVDDVIRIVYQGDQGAEWLMLPRAESYLEIYTPAGEPTFGGAAYDGTALPSDAGYAPRGVNNLGGECYPISDALAAANCPANGMINPANGNLWLSITDLRAENGVYDLTLTRSYNSHNYLRDGAFGRGWSSEYPLDYAVAFDRATSTRRVDFASLAADAVFYPVGLDVIWSPRGVVTFTTGSGSRHVFVRDDDAANGELYRALTMPGWTLTRADVRDAWTLRQPDGFTYQFDRAGRLTAFGYPAQGHAISIRYPYSELFDGPGALGDQPVIVTDAASQRQIELYYDANHHITRSVLRDLTQSAQGDTCQPDAGCFETRYRYNNGLLTQVQYASGQTATYAYDAMGRLIVHHDPRAPIMPRMAYTYAGETGGEVSAAYLLRIDELLPDEDTQIYQALNVQADSGDRVVTLTGMNGLQTTYTYRVTSGDLRAVGTSWTLSSSASPLVGAGDLDAVPTTYQFTDGLLTGLPARTLPGVAQRGRGAIAYTYLPNGELESMFGAAAGFEITPQQIAADPVPLTVPEVINFADDTSVQFGGYNEAGFYTRLTDQNGAVYEIERDDANRPITVTRTSDGVRYVYTYDAGALNLVTSVTTYSAQPDDPGYTVRYAYDGLGRLTQIDDPLLGAFDVAYVSMQADESGMYFSEIIVTDAAGVITRSRFDARDRLVEVEVLPAPDAPFIRRTTYEYDPADPLERVSAAVRWLRDGSSLTEARTTYTYASETELNYGGDPVFIGGERVTITDPYGRVAFIVYDALGRARLMGDSRSVLRWDYSTANPQSPPPNQQTYPYGLAIRQRDYLDGALIADTNYVFDGGWQLVGVRRSEGSPLTGTPAWVGEWRLLPETVNATDQRYRRLQAPALNLDQVVWEGSFEAGRATSAALQIGSPLDERGDQRPNLAVSYDVLGRPTQIVRSVNGTPQTINLVYCPGSNGSLRVLRSTPDADITCESGISMGAALAITYDAHGRIIQVEDELGTREYTYTARPSAGGVSVGVDASDGERSFTWLLEYNAMGERVHWIDENGFNHRYTYDTLGRLRRVQVDDMPEASLTYTYNLADLLTRVADDNGRGWIYAYDPYGALIFEQNVLTGEAITYTYDARGLLVNVVSPSGTVTTYAYEDPADPHRITAVITAGGRDQFAWDDDAQTITHIDALGARTVYAYDSLSALWRVGTPEGRLYDLIYNTNGALINWRTSGETEREITVQPNFMMRAFTVSEANTPDWSWTFGFTPNGRLERVTNPSGGAAALNRDPFGRLAGIDAGSDRTWTFARENSTPGVTVNDAFGNTNVFRFDALFRQLENARGDASTSYTYLPSTDGSGTVNIVRDENGDLTVYTLFPGDQRNPPQAVARERGRRLVYTYDAAGLLEAIAEEVCLGDAYTELSLEDAATYSVDDPLPCAAGETNVWRASVRFRYDDDGRPIRLINPEQNITSFAYDEGGRLITYSDENGSLYSYRYDALDRLTRVITPEGFDFILDYALDQVAGVCQAPTSLALSYAACADPNGNNGVLESYDYDALGRLVRLSFPNNGDRAAIEGEYGAAGGGGITQWGGAGYVYSQDGLSLLTEGRGGSFGYADLNRLANIGGQSVPLAFSYDDAGDLIALSAGDRTLSITREADQAVVLRDESSGAELRWTPFGSGLLESVSASAGGDDPVLSVNYIEQNDDSELVYSIFWGDDYQLDFRVNRVGEEISVEYLPFGEQITNDFNLSPRGDVRERVIETFETAFLAAGAQDGYLIVQSYDQNGNPLTMRVNDSGGGRLLYQVAFVYNADGQLETETRQYADGTQITIAYAYQNRQLSARQVTVSRAMGVEVTTDTYRFAHTYDGQGNLTGISTDDEQCAAFTYDGINRLTNAVIGGQSSTFGYDAYGRLVSAGDVQFIYGDESAAPLVIIDGEPQFYAMSENGVPFFRAGDDIAASIYGGGGQILGVRPYGNDDPDENAVWLFDPYLRFLTFAPPAADADPCVLLALNNQAFERDDLPAYQPLNGQVMWDTQTGLMFDTTRVYLPEIARYMQRSPFGISVSGSAYAFNHASTPLVQQRDARYDDGMLALLEGVAVTHHAAAADLTARAVLEGQRTTAAGYIEDAFIEAWFAPQMHLRNELATLLNLPNWLAQSYNLPTARFDLITGDLHLPNTYAPGQGGWDAASGLNFDGAIWQMGGFVPTPNDSPLTTFNRLLAQAQPMGARFSMYHTGGWRMDFISAYALVPPMLPTITLEDTPAAVLRHLPHPLEGFESAGAVLQLTEGLARLVEQRGGDWVEAILARALPSAPDALPETAQAWLARWFTDDTLGIRGMLEAFALPDVPTVERPALNP